MRTENSIKNIIMNFLYNLLNYGVRFASRIIFVKTLAEVYLGVNGLLSNVLGILALTELGIGTAIGYSLYEPLAKKNVEKTRSLMEFYKKAYRIIALIILVLGLIVLPVLPYLIKDTTEEETEPETEVEKDETFYTRSMDLSDADFDLDSEFNNKKTPTFIKVLIIIILLVAIAISVYFLRQYL